MQNIPIWKPIVIVAVIGLWALSLYPPSERLKPGLDLAGGTTLVYQVEVPVGQDPKTIIEQTISALRKRVDPDGVRNLIWRPQTGNRIEIQVPLPPANTTALRQTYLDAREVLLHGNISEGTLDVVLRTGGERRATELQRLAGDDEQRRALLSKVSEAYDELAKVAGPYEQAQEQVHEATQRLDALPMVDEGRSALQAEIKRLEADLIAKTRPFTNARRKFNAARRAVLDSNIDPIDIQRVLDLPDQPTSAATAGGQPGPSRREAAFAELVDRYPGRAEQIGTLQASYRAYEEVKGPLDDPNDLITLLRGSGVLEFRVAAPIDMPDSESYRDRLEQKGPKAGTTKEYRWFKIDDPTSFADTVDELKQLQENPRDYMRVRGQIGQEYGGDYYILLANIPGMSLTQAQEGWRLSAAYPTIDQDAFRVVGFELNALGGKLMGELTESNTGSQMAIVLDGRVISTPVIRSKIQGSGIITGGRGGYSPGELNYLLRTLNAGSLQGRLSPSPIYIRKFGPQLGQDNLDSGLRAAMWALIAVAIFMAVYYMFSGLVADLALAANVVLILGTMSIFDATFTLPGIAGIVLTIGMAVDANVLIFERIREEQRGHADVESAVQAGYEKALATIIDANITTLITCVVLYYTATAEIKGFSLTLMIGILATMFTALFCTHVIVDIYLALTGAKRLGSLPSMVPALEHFLHPKMNWVGKRVLFVPISLVLIVSGVLVIGARGQEMFDIEFRGGTQVSFSLADGKNLTIQEVRERLDKAAEQSDLPDLSGERATVVTVGLVEGTSASEFSVATVEQNVEAVSDAIKAAFQDVLDTQRPIGFIGMGADHEAPAPPSTVVFPIEDSVLGKNIDLEENEEPVDDFIGGVAILLDGMDPAPTLEDLSERVRRMRLQPAYDGLSYRTSRVVGLNLAPGEDTDEQPRYQSAVVLTTDSGTNYIEEPDTFSDSIGLAATEWELVHDALRRDTSLDSVSNFSGQVSNTMKQQAVVAMVLSLMAVVVYIWFRFGSIRYGLAAIAALVHDVAIVLGLIALTGLVYDTSLGTLLMLGDFKINLALVAALLTIVGYSLNDTIVVFDRVRENRGRLAHVNPGIVNDSINQTFSRTLMTSITTFLAVFTLYAFGGDGVHGFAFAMMLGVLVGTYSSVAIAAPILVIGQGGSTSGRSPTAEEVDMPETLPAST